MTEEEILKEARKAKRMKNLIPMNERSPEERKALQSKGGKAGSAAAKRNRTFKEALNMVLKDKAFKGNVTVEKVRNNYPDLTNRDAMAIAMVAQAIQKQDVKAFIAIRDTVGEQPVQNVNMKNDAPMTIRIQTIEDGMPLTPEVLEEEEEDEDE